MIDWLRNLFPPSQVVARDGSTAIGRDNFGQININHALGESQFAELKAGQDLQIKLLMAQQTIGPSSETAVREAVDQQLDAEIDSIAKLIEQHKFQTAFQLLTLLYERVAPTASGRIKFRIKANIGICHYALNDELKAADLLLEAYLFAPNEPKSVSNKVLALQLQGRFDEAYKFATEELNKNPTNETLAGYLIQTARMLPAILNPLEEIPEALHDSAPVLVGYIHFLQGRKESSKWRSIALKAAELHPDNEHLTQYAAEAKIGEVFEDPNLLLRLRVSDTQREALSSAAKVLHRMWDARSVGEGEELRPEHSAMGTNLLTLYFVLQDGVAIQSFSEHVMRRWPAQVELIETVSHVALQAGNMDVARKSLALLPDIPSVQFLRFHFQAVTGDWEALAITALASINSFPEPEQTWAHVACEIAKLKVQEETPSKEKLQPIAASAEKDERALVLFAKAADEFGCSTLANDAYKDAVALISNASHIAARLMVAREASARSDWPSVIRLLDGFVETHIDSHELYMLAKAYCSIFPVQEASVKFFNSLPAEILGKGRHRILHGLLYYNCGTLDKAEALIAQAYSEEKTNIHTLLVLIQTYIRIDKAEKVAPLLATLPILKMQGSPENKMHLAQLLAQHGRGAEAASYAYQTLCTNSHNAVVATGYVGLLLFSGNGLSIPQPDTVTEGCWFDMQNQNGERFRGCVTGEVVPIGTEAFAVTHPMVTSALGKKVGDTVNQKKAIGPVLVWTITSIKHRYIHALHDVMESYENRFPGHPALFMVRTHNPHDINPILEMVKDHSTRREDVLRLYTNEHYPIALIGKMLGVGTVVASGQIRQSGQKIVSNAGNLAALEAEISRLSTNSLLALDTYTAWFLACTDLLPVLKRAFPQVCVPRSSIDDLQMLYRESSSPTGAPTFGLTWSDGQYFRTDYTLENRQRQSDFIKEQIGKITSYCSISPQVWAIEPNPLAKKVMETAGSNFWDAAILATGDNAILLSEDQYYRHWAGAVFGNLEGTWLQAVFKYLHRTHAISLDEYAASITSLAQWQHDFLSIDTDALKEVYKQDDSELLEKFSALVDFLGTKNADWLSHIRVAKGFLIWAWSSALPPDQKVARATGILLGKMTRFRESWAIIVALLIRGTTPDLTEYVTSWLVGHLRPLRALNEAVAVLKKMEVELGEKIPL